METVQLAEFHRSRPNVDDKSVVFIPAARRHRRRWLEGEWRCPALKLQRPQNSCMQRNQDCWPCFHDRMRPLHENACTHIGARGTYLSRPRVRVNSPLPSLRLLKIFYLAIFFFIFFSKSTWKSKLYFAPCYYKSKDIREMMRNFNFHKIF